MELFGRLTLGSVSHPVKTVDISLGGALLAAVEGAVAGTYGHLELPSLGSLRCRIVAVSALGCHLAFEHENSPPAASRTASDPTRQGHAARAPRQGRSFRNASTPAL